MERRDKIRSIALWATRILSYGMVILMIAFDHRDLKVFRIGLFVFCTELNAIRTFFGYLYKKYDEFVDKVV